VLSDGALYDLVGKCIVQIVPLKLVCITSNHACRTLHLTAVTTKMYKLAAGNVTALRELLTLSQ
jgi:hypothetical protein